MDYIEKQEKKTINIKIEIFSVARGALCRQCLYYTPENVQSADIGQGHIYKDTILVLLYIIYYEL